MVKLPLLSDMLSAGVHFGHQKSRWHPKMEQYLFGVRNGVHVIDLDKTLVELEKALDYVKTLAAQGKVILFVGTKRQAREYVKAAAESCGMPFLTERWVGGLLTNFDEFRKRLKKYKGLKEMVATGEIEKYVKKEQVALKKQLEKMDKYLAGLVNLEKLPEALYLADLRVEKTAATEAKKTTVNLVAVCDSNVDPTEVQYPIPGNDDAVNAIKMIADLVAEAVNEGKAEYEKNKANIKEIKPAAVTGGVFVKEVTRQNEAKPIAPVAKLPAKIEVKKVEAEKKEEKVPAKKITAKPAAKKTAVQAEKKA